MLINHSNVNLNEQTFFRNIANLIPVIEGGGVTTIYGGTGCAIFWGTSFRAENKFGGIIFGKITSSHKFGVSF